MVRFHATATVAVLSAVVSFHPEIARSSGEQWQAEHRIDVLAFANVQEPADSLVNAVQPDMSRYQTGVLLRPDFWFNAGPLSLMVKPRVELVWSKWDDGARDGDTETSDDVFVNEWYIRARLHDTFFASFGRENLQWGPSYLLSPSNPFAQNNGRNNPWRELPGMEYAKTLWIPSLSWSVSLIANTGLGQRRLLFDEFQQTYAVKADYTAQRGYVSLVGSDTDDGDARLGFYGGYSPADELILYLEGNLREDFDPSLLIGGNYTFLSGDTLTLELYRNGAACEVEPFAFCFLPGSGHDREQVLNREFYALLQYYDSGLLAGRSALTLRWIKGFDDGSSALIGIWDYDLNDHADLFAVASLFLGDRDSEIRSLLDYSLMAGINFSF